jgi:hypothetical protein
MAMPTPDVEHSDRRRPATIRIFGPVDAMGLRMEKTYDGAAARRTMVSSACCAFAVSAARRWPFAGRLARARHCPQRRVPCAHTWAADARAGCSCRQQHSGQPGLPTSPSFCCPVVVARRATAGGCRRRATIIPTAAGRQRLNTALGLPSHVPETRRAFLYQ